MNSDDIIHYDKEVYSERGEQIWIYNKNGIPGARSIFAGTGEYADFLDNWNMERHENLLQAVNNYINVADSLFEFMNG